MPLKLKPTIRGRMSYDCDLIACIPGFEHLGWPQSFPFLFYFLCIMAPATLLMTLYWGSFGVILHLYNDTVPLHCMFGRLYDSHFLVKYILD
jgi:hypothetical protein